MKGGEGYNQTLEKERTASAEPPIDVGVKLSAGSEAIDSSMNPVRCGPRELVDQDFNEVRVELAQVVGLVSEGLSIRVVTGASAISLIPYKLLMTRKRMVCGLLFPVERVAPRQRRRVRIHVG